MDTNALVVKLGQLVERAPLPGLVAVYLFGSRARGTARPDSDVDVAIVRLSVDGPRFPTPELLLEGSLESALGLPVQVVLMNAAPPDLVHRIMRDGIVVWEGDRSKRIAFEVRARNDYFDLAPRLLEYRRSRGEVA